MSSDITVQSLFLINVPSKQLLRCTFYLDGNAGASLTFLDDVDGLMILLDGRTTSICEM
jgi:hypothetical protein